MAAFWHPGLQQVLIAHRGTKLTNLWSLWSDAVGVVLENHVLQMGSPSTFELKVVSVLQGFIRMKGPGPSFQLFCTRHSLRGWLGQVTTFTTEYLKREVNFFLRSVNDNYYYHAPHSSFCEPRLERHVVRNERHVWCAPGWALHRLGSLRYH